MAESNTEIPMTQYLYRIMDSARLSRDFNRRWEGVDVLWAIWGEGPEDDPSLHARIVRGRNIDPQAPGSPVHSVAHVHDEQGAYDLQENHGDELVFEEGAPTYVQDESVPAPWRRFLVEVAADEAAEEARVRGAGA